MLTADTITDEQIRELWGDYAITIQVACMALSTDSTRKFPHESVEMFAARKRARLEARARCAEILNARAVKS